MQVSLCKIPTDLDIIYESFLTHSLKVSSLFLNIPRSSVLFVSDIWSDLKVRGGREAVFRYEKDMNLVLDTFTFNLLTMIRLMTLMSSLLFVSENTSLDEFLNLHVKVLLSANRVILKRI